MAQFEYLDLAGLQTYDAKIKAVIATKVDKVEGKGLSANDFTNEAVAKLNGIAEGAQVNVLEGVKVNGQALTATDKVVDVTVPTKVGDLENDAAYITAAAIPTKVSDFENDAQYITLEQVPEGVAASNTVPLMDGVAAVGTENAFARGDHKHPSDDSKVDKTITINGQALSANVELDYEDVGAAPEVHVHDVATDAVNGFMSAADKAKLDGIEEGANAYVLPKATAADLGGVTVGSNITVADGAISLVKANVTNALGYVPMTSEEINSAIATAVAAAPHLKREIVDALPELSAAKEDIIYMLVEDADGGQNIYGEYMKVNGAWEKLGTTAADLTDYTKEADFGSISDEAINALFA